MYLLKCCAEALTQVLSGRARRTAVRQVLEKLFIFIGSTKSHSTPVAACVAGKRNAAFACQLAMGAVQKLFNAAGGRALYTDSVLQRQFRDCFAAAAHHSVVWDGAAAEYGRYVLGLHRGQ